MVLKPLRMNWLENKGLVGSVQCMVKIFIYLLVYIEDTLPIAPVVRPALHFLRTLS